MARLFLIVNGIKGQTTVTLFESLAAKLAERHDVELVTTKRYASKLAMLLEPRRDYLSKVWSSDTVIVHSPVVTSLQEVVLASVLRKRIIAVVWDLYPESIVYLKGTRLTRALKLYGLIEDFLLRRAHKLIVSNKDYSRHPSIARFRNVQEFTMWQSHSRQLPVARRETDGPLQIAFAGQINHIRNPYNAVLQLIRATTRPIVLHVFSPDPFLLDGQEPLPRERVTIVEHSFLPEAELAARLNQFDAGLVSLDPSFPLPAFPSKMFSYVDAALPILFYGPERSAVHEFIADTGVGLSLGPQTAHPIDDNILALKDDFDEARRRFSATTDLTWERLGDFL